MMSDENYFILIDGEQTGPFTFDELTEMELDLHTRVLSPIANTWADACDLPEFYPYFEALGIYLPTEDNLASFWWRLLAFVIDYFILSFLFTLIIILLPAWGLNFKMQTINDVLKLSDSEKRTLRIIICLTVIVYNSVCEASAMKGSVGKRICRLVVVDVEGTGLSYFNALLRSIVRLVSLFYGLGFLSIFFSEHRQALHDYVAKTYVVKRD